MRHLASRLVQAAIATFGVVTLVFFVMHLSGDPTLLLAPEGASAEQIAPAAASARLRPADLRAVSQLSRRHSRMATSASRWCSGCRCR